MCGEPVSPSAASLPFSPPGSPRPSPLPPAALPQLH